MSFGRGLTGSTGLQGLPVLEILGKSDSFRCINFGLRIKGFDYLVFEFARGSNFLTSRDHATSFLWIIVDLVRRLLLQIHIPASVHALNYLKGLRLLILFLRGRPLGRNCLSQLFTPKLDIIGSEWRGQKALFADDYFLSFLVHTLLSRLIHKGTYLLLDRDFLLLQTLAVLGHLQQILLQKSIFGHQCVYHVKVKLLPLLQVSQQAWVGCSQLPILLGHK